MTAIAELSIRDRMLTSASSALFLGIDIGLQGGIAVVREDGELITVADMPVLHDGPKNRKAISAPLFAELAAGMHVVEAFVENVGPRPLEGAVGGFAFGRCKGVVEGGLAALSVPVTFIQPAVWKRCVGIAPGKAGAKDAARAEAIRRWPAQAGLFKRVRDDGRAEACLIAIAGIMRRRTTS
jgi:crossover junction endodeoxyribonuclease RuvC